MNYFRRIIGGLVLRGDEALRVLRLLPLLVGVSLVVLLSKRNNNPSLPIINQRDTVVYMSNSAVVQPVISESRVVEASEPVASAEPFEFDPNTIDLDGLVALGFSSRQATVIINYRKAGAKFRVASDFAKCYSVSEEMFARLSPYIRIESPPSEDVAELEPESVASVESAPESAPAVEPSEVIVESIFPIELNAADSATLVLVRGIGALTAGRIVEYREKLGGFVSASQLSEVKGMMEQNYLMILEQIWVDSCIIRKIDVNFAAPKLMLEHPYISDKGLAKIVKNRELKGGWRTTEEFKDDNIVSGDEFERLRPYLLFRAQQETFN